MAVSPPVLQQKTDDEQRYRRASGANAPTESRQERDEPSEASFAVRLHGLHKRFPARGSAAGDRTGEVVVVRDFTLDIRQGEFFTLLGPSGCGKTTTLRMIAGFEQPTRGHILINEQPMERVPPNKRPVNTVFQNYALFPHLTVEGNVAFGLNIKRTPRAEAARQVREALTMVQMESFAGRKPAQLSGGQQQRVALARALVNRPAVLLLDEPLGALDLKLRKAMQSELKQLQQQVGITFIYVTHDQEEALTMSDRIAVMNAGEMLQTADPVTLYEQPATRFVAEFIGETNFITAQVHELHGNGQVAQLEVGLGENAVVLPVLPNAQHGNLLVGSPVTLTIRPERLSLAASKSDVSAGWNMLPGVVREVVYIGTDTRYRVALTALTQGENLIARVQNTAGQGYGQFHVGDDVQVMWSPADARLLIE